MTAAIPPVTTLDVRAAIAAGEEPLEQILAAAATVPEGSAFDLVAPFDPTPLYTVLRLRGFRSETTPLEGGATRVRFEQTGITRETTLRDVAARGPAFEAVLGKYGMDSCCGGPKTLGFAANAHRVELGELLGELQSLER
jgi:hypothetical protein